MLLRDMPKHSLDFGFHKRLDGEIFALAGQLYESPSTIDFWLLPITATHEKWQVMRFTLMVPKKIASTVSLATALAHGDPLAQVKSFVDRATSSGRDMEVCWSNDGWILT